jgi:Fuc2NAc and GlcNAc transferase
MDRIIVLILLFVSTLFLTKFVCFLANKRRWLDIPDVRSSHSRPTPKSGGIGIVVTFLGVSCFLFYNNSLTNTEFAALLCGFIIAVLGLIDDLKTLGIRIRIGVHFLLVLLAIFLLGGPPEIPLIFTTLSFQELQLTGFGYLAASLVFVWIINFYNFMDGIDGLAALQTIFVCLATAIIIGVQGANEEAFLLLCLAVTVSGFLLMNLPPAEVFMGDTGSYFLGYMIGVLGLITIKEELMDVWSWGVLLGVFVVDSTSTLLQRMRSGQIWYHAHRSHAYQMAAISYKSHSKVDAGVMLINCMWLFPLAWLNMKVEGWGVVIIFLAYLPLLLLGKYFKNK